MNVALAISAVCSLMLQERRESGHSGRQLRARSGLGYPYLPTRVNVCILTRCKSAQQKLRMLLKLARYCGVLLPNSAKPTTEMILEPWGRGSAIKRRVMCGPGLAIQTLTLSLQQKARLSLASEPSRLLAKSSLITCRRLPVLEVSAKLF